MPEQQGKYARYAEDQREGKKIPLLAQKIYIRVAKELHQVYLYIRSMISWTIE
jgi:hypothetical protein